MKKLCILISTYNGEKYVREQLDSILNQSFKDFDIIIRDDGSKDSTVNIVKDYMKKYDNIQLIEGENLGFIKSFFELLKTSGYEYYAYCDQDDFWMENKVELAVNELDKADNSKPNMVFGNSDYYDENMKFTSKGEEHRWFGFTNSLYECCGQGMTMTINNVAREMIIDNIPEKCLFHDWWTYMICSGMGNVFYNDTVTVKYRRFAKNATAEGRSKIEIFKWRINNLFKKDGMEDIIVQQQEYKKLFYDKLSTENKKILNLFVKNEKNTCGKVLKKVFYPHKLRRKFVDEMAVRVLFLFGIL